MAVDGPTSGIGAIANSWCCEVAEFASEITAGQVQRIHDLDVDGPSTVVVGGVGKVAIGQYGI